MKVFHLSIIVFSCVAACFTVLPVFALYSHGSLDLEKTSDTTITQLEFNNSTITFEQYINKTTYDVGETIYVYGQLRNVGARDVYVSYLGPATSSVLKDQNGKLIDSFGGAYVLEGGPYGNATLRPNTTTTLRVWDFPRNVVGGGPWTLQVQPAKITADEPGIYYVRSVINFNYGADMASEHSRKTTLWSTSLQITVLPEKYVQNRNSTISQNTIVNEAANNCDKKISNERDSILNSIDKQRAISLAESDKDFQGLVGDSKYIAGEPSVGGNVDYNKCSLVDPIIQVQFNVLTPNSNLGNCPYVIAVEDEFASKVLAIDLGFCSVSSAPIPNLIDMSQTSAVIVVGGIIGATAGGLSIFIMMKKK